MSDLLNFFCKELKEEQSADSTLQPLLALVSSIHQADEDILFPARRHAVSTIGVQAGHMSSTVLQVVVPCKFSTAVMDQAHNEEAVKKRYDRTSFGLG